MGLLQRFYVLLFFCYCALAVTVIPWNLNLPKQYEGSTQPVASERDMLFLGGSPFGLVRNASKTQIIMSSHRGINASAGIHPSQDSFVRGTIDAWAQHQHLVVRPEDVWFTIMVQMNFYMTKHADDKEVREKFVNHQGKEKILVVGTVLYDVIKQFQFEIQKRVKTSWLLDWIQPKFSTSTEHDGMMANVLMMGLMKSYFEFYASVVCGIPSITLLGTQKDWERLLAKLDRMPEFGAEAEQYSKNLRPVLSRFVRTFEAPEDPEIRKFWGDIVATKSRTQGCSGVLLVTGWINGFHHWDSSGNLLPSWRDNPSQMARAGEQNEANAVLDGIVYPWRKTKDFPVGHATVPINLDLDGSGRFKPGELAAGMMGKNITKGIPEGYAAAMQKVKFELPASVSDSQHGIIQPVSAWFLYWEVQPNTYPEFESKPRESLDSSVYKGRQLGQCGILDAPILAQPMKPWVPYPYPKVLDRV
jgi:hypothetical protein